MADNTNNKEYVGLSGLRAFLTEIKARFATKDHGHKITDITDYVVDNALDEDSTNPVQNSAIYQKFNEVEASIGNITSGTTVVEKAKYADSADSVDWDKVDNKPDTFAPSAHSHDEYYDKTTGEELATTLAAVKKDVDTFFKDASFAESAKDTLKEIQEYITTDTADAANMLISIGNKAEKTHSHTIAANVLDSDDVIVLTGTNGDNAVTYSASHANSGVTAGTYKSVTVDEKGHVTGGTNPTTLSGYGITDAYTKTETDKEIESAIATIQPVDDNLITALFDEDTTTS